MYQVPSRKTSTKYDGNRVEIDFASLRETEVSTKYQERNTHRCRQARYGILATCYWLLDTCPPRRVMSNAGR